MIYRSAFLAPETYHHAVAKWLIDVLAVVGLANLGFTVVGLDICIEQVVKFAVMVVGHAIVGIILLMKEGFGRMVQPVNMSGRNQLKTGF